MKLAFFVLLIFKLIIEHCPLFKRIYSKIQPQRDSQKFEMLVKNFILAVFYFAPVNLLPTSITTDAEFESKSSPLIAEERFEEVHSEKLTNIETEGKKQILLFKL